MNCCSSPKKIKYKRHDALQCDMRKGNLCLYSWKQENNFIFYINTAIFKNSCWPGTEVNHLFNHSGQVSCDKEKVSHQYTDSSKKHSELLNWKREDNPDLHFPSKLKREGHGNLQEDCFPIAHNHYKE